MDLNELSEEWQNENRRQIAVEFALNFVMLENNKYWVNNPEDIVTVAKVIEEYLKNG